MLLMIQVTKPPASGAEASLPRALAALLFGRLASISTLSASASFVCDHQSLW